MEHRKIKIPETHRDITLRQYIKYRELCERELEPKEFIKRKVMIFTGLKYHEVEKVELSDYANLLSWVDTALETEAPFEYKFTLHGTEFGFIPNFDEIQAKEFFDLSTYHRGKKSEVNLNKTMAVLFRPIIAEDALGNYEIEPYRGTARYAEVMLDAPMHIVIGALFFFRNLRTELSMHTLTSLEAENPKEDEQRTSLRNGVGTQRYMKWLRARFGSLSILKTWKYTGS